MQLPEHGQDAKFYLLICRVCGDDDLALPMPFDTPRERGQWAAQHRNGTGHDSWRVWDEPRSAVPDA